MDFIFNKKKISGILIVLPHTSISFEDEMANYNFSKAKSMKLKLAMGYKEHRIAEKGQCSSDFCIYGLQYLFDNDLYARLDNLIDSLGNIISPTRNKWYKEMLHIRLDKLLELKEKLCK